MVKVAKGMDLSSSDATRQGKSFQKRAIPARFLSPQVEREKHFKTTKAIQECPPPYHHRMLFWNPTKMVRLTRFLIFIFEPRLHNFVLIFRGGKQKKLFSCKSSTFVYANLCIETLRKRRHSTQVVFNSQYLEQRANS